MLQTAFFLLMMGFAMVSFLTIQQRAMENDWTENAAMHLAQTTQAAASRMFEMGSQFVVHADYAGGSPPGDPGSLIWLKDPATCAIAGIPALPVREDGNPVSQSFVPCDFDDQNIFGSGYNISWTTVYPGTRMTIQVGDVPFTVNGQRRDDIGGSIAVKAARHTLGGLGQETLETMINYDFDPATGSLTATIDRTSPFAADAHLRLDGGNMMDAAAEIRWGNGMDIAPNGAAMELSAPAGIGLMNDTTINGDLTVTGDATVAGDLNLTEGVVNSVLLEGTTPALLSRAVYDVREVVPGDIIPKPSCPATSVPQIFLAMASAPVGEAMNIALRSGGSVSGNIKRFRTTASDLGGSWEVHVGVFVESGGVGAWYDVAPTDGEIRATIKCS